MSDPIVVLGGGIAGVCCAEELCRILPEAASVTLVTATDHVKGVDNLVQVTKNIEEFDVVEKRASSLNNNNLHVKQAYVEGLDITRKELKTTAGVIKYGKLCICTGASPKVATHHERVITIRDTESVAELNQRLEGARRVMVVGNGGIAMEFVGAARAVGVVWVARHEAIGDAFFDKDAAEFLAQTLAQRPAKRPRHAANPGEGPDPPLAPQRSELVIASGEHSTYASFVELPRNTPDVRRRSGVGSVRGSAVGPEWIKMLRMVNSNRSDGCDAEQPCRLQVELECEVLSISDEPPASSDLLDADSLQWPVYVTLTNGRCYGVDLVVSATGVVPNTLWVPDDMIAKAPDGGLLVDKCMRTSAADVYAAGDACTVGWQDPACQWFQMRLWTQARLHGRFAAHCMVGSADELAVGFNFELFTHTARFFGFKVVLLGRYNGQGLESADEKDMVSYSRTTPAPESAFVRVLLSKGRMVGAVLIGDTGLEETMENLILDGLDLSHCGPNILDPDVDIEDYFD